MSARVLRAIYVDTYWSRALNLICVWLTVTPRRDVSRAVSSYVDTILYTVFLLYVCCPDFLPLIICTLGNMNKIKEFTIKRDTIEIPTQGL